MIGEYALLALLLVLGPGLVVAAPIYAVHRRRFLRRAVETPGTVVGSDWEKRRDDGPSTYRLTIRYRGPDGRELTFEERGLRQDAATGTPVTVLYDPARPTRAHIAFDAGKSDRDALLLALAGAVVITFTVVFFLGNPG
ncbi:hypothetical protein DPM19_15865 [Actinomadura craniellae]|uniref:DUF3592 domain-containing protein n=1 Tax=Actinomadura craniellae TaxID=2231787 RepID=A0A365H610_9ACTN|nr:DUF3592 domain-containing protein [Actinomadura craniellae]RAY14432.1 hypothetical protein DPM19_15865 [Actinomadura craniellae]